MILLQWFGIERNEITHEKRKKRETFEIRRGGKICSIKKFQDIKLSRLGTSNFLGDDCTLIIAAVIENVDYYCEDDDLKKLLKRLLKRMKYGLVTQTSIILYEMGFNDRVVATEIADVLDEEYVAGNRKEVVNLIQRDINPRQKIE